ncbi:MAG: alpha/beta fold hydrolase [Bacteroidota bacterium]
MHRSYFRMLLRRFVFLVVISSLAMAQESQKAPGQLLSGAWQGTLSVPGGSLRVVFNFKPKAEGGYTATLDSPDQGAFGIPADSVIVQDTLVRVSIQSIGGELNGVRVPAADSISGTWSQGGMQLPLVLKYSGKVTEAPKRPQEPKKPYPYKDEEVTVSNAAAGITLAGTLTLPSSAGPFPAVVLITGSGPQDRDEALLGHKPFLVLSDYLTRQGIAVLRCDDRGTGKSTGKFGGATSVDFAGDAMAALAYLKSRKEVRADKMGLIGHSEGGMIAPMVAAESNDVAFIVMMAGPGVPGDKLILEQVTLITRAMGKSEKEIQKQHELNRKIYDVVESGEDSAAVASELRTLILSAADSTALKNPQANNAAINARIAQVTSPWFKYFLTYDPRPTLKKVRCPVLAINGEKDLQVPPKQNLPEIQAALQAGGNKDFTIRELPGLNHLFQAATKGTPDEYAKIEETISPTALKLIGDWILEKSR